MGFPFKFNFTFTINNNIIIFHFKSKGVIRLIRKSKIVNNILLYGVVFFITCLALLVAFKLQNFYPFGDKTILILDMGFQYFQYYAYFYDVLHGNASLLFNWQAGLGMNFFGVFTYYLSSPFSLIISFFSRDHLIQAITMITFLKLGSCGISMCFYLRKGFKAEYVEAIIFSTMYALASYTIVFYQNLMWIDGLIYLPLVLLSVEKLIKDKSGVFLTISLAVLFISNFYISYMVGAFTFMYFLSRLIIIHDDFKIKKFIYKAFQFLLHTVLAAGIAAIIIFPTLEILKDVSTNAGKIPWSQLQTFGTPFDIYLKLFNQAYDGVFFSTPYIYVGLLAVLFVPIFFLTDKISKKEKIVWGLNIIVFILSFILYPLYVVWHGFKHPNGYEFRFSFVFSFLLVFLSWNVYHRVKNIKSKVLFLIIFANVFILSLASKWDHVSISKDKILINILLLFILGILIFLLQSNNKFKRLFEVLLICFVFTEMTINSSTILEGLNKDSAYKKVYEYQIPQEIRSLIANIKSNDKEFYRLEKKVATNQAENIYQINDSLKVPYNSIANYTSTGNVKFHNYMGSLGYTVEERGGLALNNTGSTLFTEALLGTKYVIADKTFNHFGYQKVEQEGSYVTYQNDNSLPLGFVLDSDKKNWISNSTNPFQLQNNMMSINQDKEYFKEIQPVNIKMENLTKDGDEYRKDKHDQESYLILNLKVIGQQELYGFITIPPSDDTQLIINERNIQFNYPSKYNSGVIDLGLYNKEKVSVKIKVRDNINLNNIHFYALSTLDFKNRIKEMASQPMDIKEVGKRSLDGEIYTTKDSTLFLSIPYDKGWNVKLDGKEVSAEKIGGFIGIQISNPGKHSIELSYTPPGLLKGLIITLSSLLILLIIVIREMKMKRNSSKDKESIQNSEFNQSA